ncbi:MAG: glycosyltransferase family 4 protein [bacterium]|nr:glycosyltransferase family 4 protein [bacterium]
MTTFGQRPKILYIVTLGVWGGAQKYVFDLSVAMSGDCNIVVACGREGVELEQKIRQKNIRFQILPRLTRQVNPLADALTFWEIFNLVKKEKPDVVHLSSSKAGALGSVAAKLGGAKKVIFTIHGLVLAEPLNPLAWSLYWLAEKFSSFFRDALIAVSNFDRNLAIKYHICQPDKITVIHNGLDISKLGFLPRDEAKGRLAEFAKTELKGKPLVVTVADFYPAKGLYSLVEAAREVLKKFPDAVFVLIGRIGPDYKKVKQAICQDRLAPNFILLTDLPAAAPYLKAADLFVLPSVKEGLPYVILEAAAAGLPIVATKVGGIPEIITDRSNGLLVPPADPKSLARAIDELLSSPELAQKFGRKAYDDAGRFGLEKMIEQTRKVYFE